MLMDNAAIIAGILYGFQTSELIIIIIILQVAGAGGAYLFGRISNRQSSKQAIIYSLLMLVVVVAMLFITHDKTFFYVIGALAGFSLSGVQAVSRTMVSQLSPPTKTAEFYGFLSVAGRTSTFIGPWVFGSVYATFTALYLNRGLSETVAKSNGILWAIGSIVIFLVVGLFFLGFVRKVTPKEPLNFDEA
jgi:UMF1 family MFS transporter